MKGGKAWPSLDFGKSLKQIARGWEQKFRRGRLSSMTRKLKPGTPVSWNTSQGKTHGHAVKRATRAGKVKGHTVAASKDNPEYIVESDKSGRRAAHKRG